MSTDAPYLRLSIFYLVYFASIGVFVPYWSVYLQSLSFTPADIGEMLAVVMVSKIFAPYLWGWLADHSGKRMLIVRSVTFAAVLCFSGALFVSSYWGLILVMAAFSFFWHAALPQFEATTMAYLGTQRARYSHIRLWGSIGFIVSVVGIGYLLEVRGPAVLPQLLLVTLGLIWLSTLLVKDNPQDSGLHDSPRPSVMAVLKMPSVILFLIACFFMQASHGPYYAFLSIYLADKGYASSMVGQLWALGVVAEIGVFLLVHRWLSVTGALRLFQLSILVTTVRWLLIGWFADNLMVLLLAQLMHAASYGLFHASAIEMVHRFFPGRLSGRGQALYASLGFGVGNAVGSLLSGYIWMAQGAEMTFIFAAGLCFIGLLFALRMGRAPAPV